LISSGLILSHNGTPVPDGSLFTVSTTGGTLLAQDGDPNTPGVQVRSLNGRIDFAVQAPALEENNQVPQPITARAAHPLADRCAGTAQITFVAPSTAHFTGLDFTSGAANDAETTNALWDTALGRVDPFPSDFGAGEDGDLTVDGTYNINTNSQPGRLFPDAVNFIVTEVGSAQVVVRGGVGGLEIGDEVLLINLQGDSTNHGNVGNYEIKEVARINYGQNTVFFTTNLDKVYGVTDSNADITGQKIMLQRVPRYRSLRVNGTLTADAWSGEKGGVMFVKVLQSTEVVGNIDMTGKGYRGSPSAYRGNGESYSGRGSGSDTGTNNEGGGAGNYYRCGSGGGFATQGSARNNMYNGGSCSPGTTYGDPELTKWFFGSGGGSSRDRNYTWPGQPAGGIVVLWTSGLSVRGSIQSRSATTSRYFGGSGGTIFLRARSMNVGNNRVNAAAQSYGGAGRIRLDFFGLSGTTTPEFEPGFAGDTVVQTNDLSGVGNPLASVTLRQALEDRRGGTISYQVSNGATDGEQNLIWHPIAPGETVNFPQNQPGTALRMRATFSNDNLQPLALIGMSLGWERTP
jgi:hypothetical protein